MSAHCLEQLSAVAAAELSRMKAAFHLQVQTHRAVRMLSPSSPSTHCSRIQIVPAFFWASFLGDDQVINLKKYILPCVCIYGWEYQWSSCFYFSWHYDLVGFWQWTVFCFVLLSLVCSQIQVFHDWRDWIWRKGAHELCRALFPWTLLLEGKDAQPFTGDLLLLLLSEAFKH